VAAADVNLSVEAQGDDIVVTLPGTSYVVTYYTTGSTFGEWPGAEGMRPK
jgi:hypothetical protein